MKTLLKKFLGALLLSTLPAYVHAHDLGLSMYLSETNLVAGDAFQVYLTVSNREAVVAQNVSVTNELPFQASFTPPENPDVTFVGSNLVWNIGYLDLQGSTNLVIDAVLQTEAVPGEWLTIGYADCGSGICTNVNRGYAEAQITGKDHVGMTSTNAVTEVEPGDQVSWCFVVTNHGPHTVYGASLNGLFPPGLYDISWGCVGTDPTSVLEPIPVGTNALNQIPTGSGPGTVAYTPDGRFLYVVNFYDASISRFARDPISGSLIRKKASTASGDFAAAAGARSIAITPNGKYLYCANSTGGDVYHYKVDRVDGSLELIPNEEPGDVGYLSGNNSRWIKIHPNGKFLYVCNFADNNLSVFSIHPGTGKLSLQPSAEITGRYASGVGPYACVFNSEGTSLYVQQREGGDITHFSVNQHTGALTKLPSQEADGNYSAAGDFSGDIAISPDDKFLYVCNAHIDSYSVFSLSQLDGIPTKIGTYPCGDWPVAVIMAMDGKYLLMVNNADEDVRVYRRNQETGALFHVPASGGAAGYPLGTYPGANGGVTPDGRHIYICNFGGESLSAFRVTGATACQPHGNGKSLGPIDIAVGGSIQICVTGKVHVANVEDIRTGVEMDFKDGKVSLVFPDGETTDSVSELETLLLRDDDHDGKPDRWEQEHDLDDSTTDHDLDSDHDGHTDYEEFISDTDPKSATSGIEIEELVVQDEVKMALYQGSPLRVYILEYRETPNDEWQPVSASERGEGPGSCLEDYGTPGTPKDQGQYRLRVSLPNTQP